MCVDITPVPALCWCCSIVAPQHWAKPGLHIWFGGLVTKGNRYRSDLCPSVEEGGVLQQSENWSRKPLTYWIWLFIFLLFATVFTMRKDSMQYFILSKKAVFNHAQDWIFQSKYRFCLVFGRFTIPVVLVLGNLHYVIFSEHETTDSRVASWSR